ncbi:Glucoamylase P like protein [Verticillium longisporum]|nr:Glucoamylase P like protein [Verticillium longisporum]
MAAHRSATRALARAFTARTAAAPAARVARPFSVSAFRANAVHEKEVPIVSWPATKDGKSSIPVNPGQQAVKEEPAEPTEVVPLTAEAYEKMTPMMQKMTVYGKVIIITGGARGLGNHMARACAEAGAKALVLFDANEELGKESANELYQKTKIPVTFLKVDVRDGDAINAAVDRVVELYGCPDVLVNSAGIADSNIKAEEYDSSMFRRLIDINLTGTFLMSQAVGKKMIAHGKPGSIVLFPPTWVPANLPIPSTCAASSARGTYTPVTAAGAPDLGEVPCAAPVTFRVDARTYYGEDIYVLGGAPSLGNWNVENAQPLTADGYTDARPLWAIDVDLDAAGQTVTYQFVRRQNCGQGYIYETVNRTVDVPALL